MFARIIVAAAVAAGCCAEAPGQNRGRRNQPQLERFEATGTIAGVGRGQIQMVTATEQKWIVGLSPQATIRVTGTAEPGYLRPGHFIRFSAALDKKGKAEGPVGELTIYTPSPQMGVGVWPEGMAVGDVGAEQPQQPNPFGGGFGVGNPGAVEQPASNRFLVAGRVTGARNGKLIVNFGRGLTEIELTEDPTINVDFADYSVAQRGDAVTVSKGKTYPNQFQMMMANPNAVGRAMAEAVEIQLTQPLAAPGDQRDKKAVRPEQPEQPLAGPGGAPGEANPFGE